MKEIIYLDTDLMNSMLAQLKKGLITSFSAEKNNQETLTEEQQSNRGRNAGFAGHIKAGTGAIPGLNFQFETNFGNTGNEIIHESRAFLEGEEDILNKVFHDYALDILQDKLAGGHHLKSGPDFKEGDLHLGEKTYKFFDFELLKNVIDYKALTELMTFDGGNSVLDMEEASAILNKKPKGKPTPIRF